MFDVIVIGAGPAGCTASKILADNGFSVLLVEKFKMPRYKSCSGQLIKKTLDLVQEYYGESVPNSAACTPVINCGMMFTDDKGKRFCFEQQGLNVWRSSFDKWLTDKAEEAGVEVRDETTALSCEEKDDIVTVTLKGIKIYSEQARYIVDCEGVTGGLKKKLTGNAPKLIYTYQTFNIGSIELNHQFFHAYLQPELSEYDAWFNVKDDQLVLGVSVKDVDKTEVYYKRFIEYMGEHYGLYIEQCLKKDKWLMPHIMPGCPIDYGIGRVLFAGEIAGFLNPMGEGISAGLESGYCVAMALKNSFDNVDGVYAKYKENVSGLRDYMIRQWAFVAKMANPFRNMGIDNA